ncbi:hypothetical protein R1sor_005823 [Riccia sorocarpa]|uniref:NADP-dependent oxidoreductase domain-containing protein n=1 Tax=Riccia sorocarpa TaxID=122646 RepID=A0ABD3HP72_9MARC
MTTFPKVALGSQGFKVSAQGLGCMGMSAFYGPPKPEDEMVVLIRKAVDHGITMLDTSDVYGPHTNEVLLGKAIKESERRWSCVPNLPSMDSKVPIEITMGALKELVEEGKVKYIGLSEASASDIRRAHAVHPITAVQIEYSLWVRDVEEDIIPTCRELGIGIVAYSPLGRGFFSGIHLQDLEEGDQRKTGRYPRLAPENLEANKKFYERLLKMGEQKNCTPGQLALAWVQHKGAVPIPGATKWKNLEENIGALHIKLTPEDIKALEDSVPLDEVKGDRYIDLSQTWRAMTSLPLEKWTGTRK